MWLQTDKTQPFVSLWIAVVLAWGTLASGCLLSQPCEVDDGEYCAEDGACVCGQLCTQQDCASDSRVCVAYDHSKTHGVCVDEQWAEDRDLRPIEALGQTTEVRREQQDSVAIPDSGEGLGEIEFELDESGYVGRASLTLDITHPKPEELVVRVTRTNRTTERVELSNTTIADAPLTQFNDQRVEGVWTIMVRDTVAGSTGRIESATLLIDAYEIE